MSCPKCQSARSPGGKKHRRRRDLLRSWRSWGEPFQRESARGAAPAGVSQFVLCIPTIGGADSGEVAKHPTRPGRTGIFVRNRLLVHLAPQCTRSQASQATGALHQPASVAERFAFARGAESRIGASLGLRREQSADGRQCFLSLPGAKLSPPSGRELGLSMQFWKSMRSLSFVSFPYLFLNTTTAQRNGIEKSR